MRKMLGKSKGKGNLRFKQIMAETEGFEPSIGCPIHAFQACAIDHSATSPHSHLMHISVEHQTAPLPLMRETVFRKGLMTVRVANMRKNILLAPLAALLTAAPICAQQEKETVYPSPNAIVDAAPASDWRAIAPSDLLVMDLAPGDGGEPRRVIIQLMPPPFAQGWIRNIRKLAAAHWWDGTSINRV